MDSYFFQGIVLPERAQISFGFEVNFSSISSGFKGTAKGSIVLNQVAVWIECKHEQDIHTLRNLVKNLVQNHLNMVGYVKGLAYDLHITRVINQNRGIDYVFGVDIPCIAERGKNLDLETEVSKLFNKTVEDHGVLLNHCFSDLASAMKNPSDTGFYCYRAIESLRHHCAAIHGLHLSPKLKQWQKFRELASCNEKTLRTLQSSAEGLRHGEVMGLSSNERAELLTKTWDVVDAYLKNT